MLKLRKLWTPEPKLATLLSSLVTECPGFQIFLSLSILENYQVQEPASPRADVLGASLIGLPSHRMDTTGVAHVQ